MNIDRRNALKGLGGLAAMTALEPLSLPDVHTGTRAHAGKAPGFPLRQDFEIAEGYTYINAAYTHPMPRASIETMRQYALGRNRLTDEVAPATNAGGSSDAVSAVPSPCSIR